ncbi:MAG: serine/threonine protein kinase, partial [Acidobacteria bacterium]|nr:serine/threonine protein kinase [Acidobacteriota bacterium]
MASLEQRVLTLTAAAIDLAPAERERLLSEVHSSDPELGRRLEAILREHENCTSVLDEPARLAALLHGSFEAAMESLLELEPGTILADRFEIERLLGIGGMGAAYAAWDRELQTRVALKVLLRKPEDLDADTRFRREIHLARQVTHPNICRVYDFFSHRKPDGNFAFLTMELIEGPTLADYLRERGPSTPKQALPIAQQIAEGLDAAHRVGIIHRDLKPSN